MGVFCRAAERLRPMLESWFDSDGIFSWSMGIRGICTLYASPRSVSQSVRDRCRLPACPIMPSCLPASSLATWLITARACAAAASLPAWLGRYVSTFLGSEGCLRKANEDHILPSYFWAR